MSSWNFFTNHGHIIILLGKNCELTIKEIADTVGITERATQKIIKDLVDDGFIKIKKIGRKNSYKIIGRKRLRHEIEKDCKIEQIIETIYPS